VDLETHINDVLAVLHYEDLSGVVLIGHSYGGMVATGVADRARGRIARLIYVDAFVPQNGQCLNDLIPAAALTERKTLVEDKGDGWLLAPNPTPSDTPPEDVAWGRARRRWQPVRTFTQPLVLRNAEDGPPRSYIYCTRRTPDDRFGPFATRAKTEAGWTYFEIDASHSPNITAPDALVHLLLRIAGS
jgi:pimeloyl-ACP methyl ester carboxylesterase